MLKTTIVYKGKHPKQRDIDELTALLPLDITWTPYKGEIVANGTLALSWAWLKTLYKKPADIQCFLLSPTDLTDAGIKSHIGLYNLDTDNVHDFYISTSRHLDNRAILNGFKSNFAWIFCHEFLHGVVWNKTKSYAMADGEVHSAEKLGKLKDMIETYNAEHKQLAELQTKLSWLQSLLASLKKKPSMIHPVPLPYRDFVSQAYGVKNNIYTKTKVHTGTDYPCSVGTPLKAPENGQIIVSSKSPQRGNYVQFKHGDYLLEMRHLSKAMPVGKYKQGDIIGLSGNTGTLTTGAHVCIVVWRGQDGLNIINKNNWQQLTVDADKLYI